MFLLTHQEAPGGAVDYKYVECTPAQEKRITELVRAQKLPKMFQLNGETILSSQILGFTQDDREIPPPPQPKFKNMDELREWVHRQDWYRRKASSVATRLKETPQPSEQSTFL